MLQRHESVPVPVDVIGNERARVCLSAGVCSKKNSYPILGQSIHLFSPRGRAVVDIPSVALSLISVAFTLASPEITTDVRQSAQQPYPGPLSSITSASFLLLLFLAPPSHFITFSHHLLLTYLDLPRATRSWIRLFAFFAFDFSSPIILSNYQRCHFAAQTRLRVLFDFLFSHPPNLFCSGYRFLNPLFFANRCLFFCVYTDDPA